MEGHDGVRRRELIAGGVGAAVGRLQTYMDGAIRSGEGVAQEILAALPSPP